MFKFAPRLNKYACIFLLSPGIVFNKILFKTFSFIISSIYFRLRYFSYNVFNLHLLT